MTLDSQLLGPPGQASCQQFMRSSLAHCMSLKLLCLTEFNKSGIDYFNHLIIKQILSRVGILFFKEVQLVYHVAFLLRKCMDSIQPFMGDCFTPKEGLQSHFGITDHIR